MGTALRLATPGGGRPLVPEQLAAVVRQEIPCLAEEIISEIRASPP